MEVTGHKAHGAIPEPGSIVIARVRDHQQQHDYIAFLLQLGGRLLD